MCAQDEFLSQQDAEDIASIEQRIFEAKETVEDIKDSIAVFKDSLAI